LDSLGIEDLSTLPFPDQTEEVSLFDNEIMNPKFIVDCLVPLPNLKAMWLNNNPVVDACSNFHAISELMPNLEICNSVLTAKAGEWAMLFYARDQGAKSLQEIKSLNLAGKGLLYMESTEVFA
jgi:tubulin--tyrosine ligase-like protein 12